MCYEEIRLTVDRAAELLPEPPRWDNPDGYARWEALTLDTGRRISRMVNADIDLLRELMDDEFCTPVACRQRRKMLLRVALLAAWQPPASEPKHLGVLPHRMTAGRSTVPGEIVESRSTWVSAKF
jgi:hypothetical protein